MSETPTKPTYRADIELLRSNVPDYIKKHESFCLWKWEFDGKRWTKVPYCPRDGKRARSNDLSSTFAPFGSALTAYISGVAEADGIGVGLCDGLSGIDIDHHIIDGKPDEFAQSIIDAVNGYTEVSPSGDGLHILFRSEKFSDKYKFDKMAYRGHYYLKRDKIGLEVYVSGITNRFLTVTGDVINDGTNRDKSKALTTVLESHMLRKPKKPTEDAVQVASPLSSDPVKGSGLSDAEIVNKICRKPNCALLWSGDWKTAGYGSQSEADLALMNELVFYTQHDESRALALFGASALGKREKWAREDYREQTIRRAMEDVTGNYDPNHRSKNAAGDDGRGEALEWVDATDSAEYDQTAALADMVMDAEIVAAPVKVEVSWWMACPHLEMDSKGTSYKNPNVAALAWILRNDPELDGVKYDEMADDIVCTNGVPWERTNHPYWTESDDGMLLEYLQTTIRYHGSAVVKSGANVSTAVMNLATSRKSNRCTEMLDSLPRWDGTQRADTLLIDFLGATNDEYTRACTILMLRAAIVRAYFSGTKFDYMPILKSSRQGIGKSTLLRFMAMDDSLFTDSVKGVGTKEAQEILQGAWIVEFSELATFKRSDLDALKLFVTQTTDKYRAPYAKKAVSRRRRCILVGTTNDDTYLKDPTGNRRFLPISCEGTQRLSVFADLTPEYVRQVWAEVKATTDPSTPLTMPTRLELAAEERRKKATIEDPWLGIVEEWLSCHRGEFVCNQSLLHLAIKIDDDRVTQADIYRMGNVMRKIPSWQKTKTLKRIGTYGRQRAYEYVGTQ